MKRTTLLIATILATASSARADEIVLATAGGVFGDTIRSACVEPFEKKTGIAVKMIAADDTGPQIQSQLRTSVQWDVVESPPIGVSFDGAEDWFEKLDWNKIDPDQRLPPIARQEYGVGFTAYSEALLYRTDKERANPSNWKEFWDVKRFPGKRALRDVPNGNLEYALLADGVSRDQIYEVLGTTAGVDRAYAKLDEIKDSITVWWTTGQQPIQFLMSGDIDYTTGWNSRYTSAVADGAPLKLEWNEAMITTAYYSIIKGSKHVDQAHEFLKFCWTDPSIGADVARRLSLPGFAPGLYDLLPVEVAKNLPTFPNNEKLQFYYNSEFWAAHRAEMQARWEAWRLGS